MSVLGLGTDIVEIARLEKQLSRSNKLAERILTKNEFDDFLQCQFQARFLAKRFAAKEAAVKALGTGIGNGVGWQQLEVTHKGSGQPLLVFSGYALEYAEKLGMKSTHISISDEQHYATATVIISG